MRRLSRRDLLKLAGGAAVAAALPVPSYAGILDRLLHEPPVALRPALTSNDKFYVTSYRSAPDIRVEQWSLAIKGLVEKPFRLTHPQLFERPAVSQIVTLECVGNGLAADAISTADWKGVPLKTLLEEAGASSQAVDVVFRAADGYSDSIPLARAMDGDVLVAHTMNGVPLPRGHGFPARIIVPGIYGMKNVQWLTEIEVVAQNYKGYYQQKGWSDEAIVKTSSHIDVPGHGGVLKGREAMVQGYAFAGTRGISRVELSMDGGESWREAALEPELSPAAWRFWRYRWELPPPGRHSLVVRATDGTGRMQFSEEQAPFPDGAAGLHEITVTVQA
jgi:DMSO/TMAO reductase YedYZ molybdopterin-dependent catalytic subunit